MPSQTTIRVTDDQGIFLFETAQFLEIGDSPGLHYVLSCGLVGALTVTLPPEFNTFLLGANNKPRKDLRVHVMRSVNGAPAQREGESCFLTRHWQFADDYTIVTALHANHILWRRCSLYAADTALSGQSNQADTDVANIWDSNYSTASGSEIFRAWDTTAGAADTTQFDLSSYISRPTFSIVAPTVAKFYPWQNLGDVIRDICDDSTLQGTYITVEIVCPTESTLEFRAYADQRGVDRRFSTGNGLLFAEARGNLANAILTVDAINEVTLVVAGGAGRDLIDVSVPDYGLANRVASDTTRMGESIFGRIEAFVDSGNATDLTQIQGDAQAAVRAGRPVISATAELQETDQCIRGIHFDYGDVVTVEVRGTQYDMRLDVLEVSLQGGVESTKASFFYDDR